VRVGESELSSFKKQDQDCGERGERRSGAACGQIVEKIATFLHS